MNIVIPTHGRVGKQITLQQLTKELRECATLVCPADEVRRHEMSLANHCVEGVRIVAQPDDLVGIARKRRWIMENLAAEDGRVIMLDDDLTFSNYRIAEDGKVKLPRATPQQMTEMFTELWEKITPDVPHAGFGPRQGASFKKPGWEVGRMLCVLGYHTPTVLAHAELGRIETKEDMDVTLQLLRAGYPNAVTNAFVADQSWGSPGGCSTWRTVESSNADSVRLAELHPGYVRVLTKEYNKVTRLEVVVSWQKAYKDGMARRGVTS